MEAVYKVGVGLSRHKLESRQWGSFMSIQWLLLYHQLVEESIQLFLRELSRFYDKGVDGSQKLIEFIFNK